MSSRRADTGDAHSQTEFMSALYDEEDVGGGMETAEECNYDEDEDQEMATSSEYLQAHSQQSRFDSQSENGTLLRIYDLPGRPLWPKDVDDGATAEEESDDCFLAPDAHNLYDCVEVVMEDQEADESDPVSKRQKDDRGSIIKKSGRLREKGIKRAAKGRGRGRGSVKQSSGATNRGEPIIEVCVNDEDIPSELREIVMNVIKKREERAREDYARREARRARVREERKRQDQDSDDDNKDEFYDATDSVLLNETDHHFEWCPVDTFQGVRETFLPERTGSVQKFDTAYAAFRSIWDDDILNHIVTESNTFAESVASQAFQADWQPTNIHEILCLFAFWMMLGIIKMPTIKSCFSTDPLLKTDIFRKIITYHRYNLLTRALYFGDLSSVDTNDPVAKFKPIIEHLNDRYQSLYVPSQNMCIDEGNIKFKATKFGIKVFELCESVTGYLWSFIVDAGKDRNVDIESDSFKSSSLVIKLVRPLFNKGYTLFMDDWFSSPLLARLLKRHGTDCVGTLRASRRDLPPLLSLAQLKPRQLIARHSSDVCVTAYQEKSKLLTLSTYHGTNTVLTSGRLPQHKPQVVVDYNRYTGGAGLKEQILEAHILEGKRCKNWFMKLFKRFLNISILNCRILLQSSSGQSQDHLDFRLRLVDAILTKHLPLCPQPRQRGPDRKSTLLIDRTPQSHWPVRVPQIPTDAIANRHSRSRCFMCSRAGNRNQKTYYKCETCNVPLCIEACFKNFHVEDI